MNTIYHNPRCGTSRTVLRRLEEADAQVHVIEYLKTPLTRTQLASLIRDAGISVRDAMRNKEPAYSELGLDEPALSDSQLIDAMADHPILLNRPFVVTEKGTRLCRPADVLNDIL